MFKYLLSLLVTLSTGCLVFAQSDSYPKHIFQEVPFTKEFIKKTSLIPPLSKNLSSKDLSALPNFSNYRTEITTKPIEIKIKDVEPFLGYALKWKENWDNIEVRFAHIKPSDQSPVVTSEQLSWTDWITLKEDPHFDSPYGTKTSSIGIQEVEGIAFFQLKFTGPDDHQLLKDQPKMFFSNPGPTKETPVPVLPTVGNTDLCACPMPSFKNREQWCPDGSCPGDQTPQPTFVTHLIVHHSAGANSASDWAAVVRIIWDFHVNGNGWDDIGYNWLVDPNGILYEGRGDNLQGAHFCGQNGNTMGVCVLGDFTNITPTPQAIDKLTELLAWKSCANTLDPLGAAYHNSSEMVLNRISGHRDGCSTACPGDSFYPTLPNVRDGVDQYIQDNCSIVISDLEDSPSAANLSVFPNPLTTNLTIDLHHQYIGQVDIKVMELSTSRLVFKDKVLKGTTAFNYQINMESLPAGSYLLEINCGERLVKKLVK